jgi:hypothetical protein
MEMKIIITALVCLIPLIMAPAVIEEPSDKVLKCWGVLISLCIGAILMSILLINWEVSL